MKKKLIACLVLPLPALAVLIVLMREPIAPEAGFDWGKYVAAEPNRTDPQELCNWFAVNILHAPEKAYRVTDENYRKLQSIDKYVLGTKRVLPSVNSIRSIKFLSSSTLSPREAILTDDGLVLGDALPPYSEYVYKIETENGWFRRESKSHTFTVEVSKRNDIYAVQRYGISTDSDDECGDVFSDL